MGEHSLEGWPGIQGSSGPCKVTARSEECLQFTTMGRQGQSLELALSLVFFFYYWFSIHKAILRGGVNLGRQIKVSYLKRTREH